MSKDLAVLNGDATPTALRLPGFTLTATGLAPVGDVSLEQCREALRDLCRMERTVHWWIGDLLAHMEHRYGAGYEKEARETGFAPQTLEIDKYVSKQFEKLRRRNFLSWAHHREVATLEPPEQDAALDLAASEGWSQRQLRAHVRAGDLAAARERAGPLPEGCHDGPLSDLAARHPGHFGTVYADPPWPYDNQATRAATGNHYAAMTLADIAALPVADLTADCCHLHLWTTNAFLFDCPRLLEAWGFTYQGVFVWCKPQIGLGNCWRVSHEFLVLGVRGEPRRFAEDARDLPSWAVLPRPGRHSEKPGKVRAMIERASPAPRLELFGREPIPGWVVWGDQIERDLFHPPSEAV